LEDEIMKKGNEKEIGIEIMKTEHPKTIK